MKSWFLALLVLLGTSQAKRFTLEDLMGKLAQDVTANVSGETAHSVIIIPLNDTRAPGFGELVEQYLTVPLVQNKNVQLIDRSQLATIMAEADLMSMSNQPAEIGKIASAEYMLTGTVSTGFDKNHLVTLRLISIKTSRVVGAASTEIPTSELEKRIRRN